MLPAGECLIRDPFGPFVLSVLLRGRHKGLEPISDNEEGGGG